MTDSFRPTVIRNQAWEALKGKWNMAALACLVYMVITGIASMLPYAGSLLSLFVLSMFAIGMMFLYQNVARGGDVEIKMLWMPFSEYTRYLVGYLLVFIYTLLWTLLFIVPGIIKGISYGMTFFIMRDNPEMKGSEAIDRSMAMMEGHKMEYFLLGLSFIGWIILGMITFGIGLLWVIPYSYTAIAKFYDEVKRDYEVRVACQAAK